MNIMKAHFYKNQIAGFRKKSDKKEADLGVLAFATNLVLGLRRMFGFRNLLSEIQFRYKIKKVLYITLYWVLFRLFQDIYDMLVLNSHPEAQLGAHYAFLVITNLFGALLGGLIGGSVIIFYIERIWRTKSTGHAIGVVSLFYTVIIFAIAAISESIYQSGIQGLPIYHPEVISDTLHYYLGADFQKKLFDLVADIDCYDCHFTGKR